MQLPNVPFVSDQLFRENSLILENSPDYVMHIFNYKERFRQFDKVFPTLSHDQTFSSWNEIVEQNDVFFRKWNWHHPFSSDPEIKQKTLSHFFDQYPKNSSEFLGLFTRVETLLKKETPFVESLFQDISLSQKIAVHLSPVVAFWTFGNPEPETIIFSMNAMRGKSEASLRADIIHEVFHAHHKPVVGKNKKPALRALWLEGMAEYVSLGQVGSKPLLQRYDNTIAENNVASFATDFLQYAELESNHPFMSSFMKHWFFTHIKDHGISYKKGYLLGYHIVKKLSERHCLSELCNWTTEKVEEKVIQSLKLLSPK